MTQLLDQQVENVDKPVAHGGAIRTLDIADHRCDRVGEGAKHLEELSWRSWRPPKPAARGEQKLPRQIDHDQVAEIGRKITRDTAFHDAPPNTLL